MKIIFLIISLLFVSQAKAQCNLPLDVDREEAKASCSRSTVKESISPNGRYSISVVEFTCKSSYSFSSGIFFQHVDGDCKKVAMFVYKDSLTAKIAEYDISWLSDTEASVVGNHIHKSFSDVYGIKINIRRANKKS